MNSVRTPVPFPCRWPTLLTTVFCDRGRDALMKSGRVFQPSCFMIVVCLCRKSKIAHPTLPLMGAST
ncbi:MAG: hypothetical protein J5932_11225 [Prevotella sp.]|nr:hypothetical protein [Prevotella sp.]MBP3775944.1 hypothetical protein [Prevotella sp.]